MSRETETLLWQGRPDTKLRFWIRSPMEFALGMACLGGPINPMLLLYLGGSNAWMYFLPMMVLGLWFLGGWCFVDAYKRRQTRYYLSSERAVIDVRWPWSLSRREVMLTPDTDLELAHPHVYFDRDTSPMWDGRPPRNIGFEYLDDAVQVADQMQRALWALSLPPKAAIRDIRA